MWRRTPGKALNIESSTDANAAAVICADAATNAAVAKKLAPTNVSSDKRLHCVDGSPMSLVVGRHRAIYVLPLFFVTKTFYM